MQTKALGSFGPVSRLTLGGGGIGMVWGPTSEEEAVATLHRAVDAGIDLIDTAPGYKACEAFVGKAFAGILPAGVRITTKCRLGNPPADEAYDRVRASLDASLAAMQLERADLLFLHTEIRPDDFVAPAGLPPQDTRSTSLIRFQEAVVPAFERLVAEGRIGAWGITGITHADATITALTSDPHPVAVQAITNLLDSAGEIDRTGRVGRPRQVIAAAQAEGVGVMGIRAVQAGALTAGLDRPDHSATADDFARAAPYRDLCRAWGQDPAVVAHRYALGMAGVDTVVLGVKNVAELDQALDAERRGPLEAEQVAAIDALGLGRGSGAAPLRA